MAVIKVNVNYWYQKTLPSAGVDLSKQMSAIRDYEFSRNAGCDEVNVQVRAEGLELPQDVGEKLYDEYGKVSYIKSKYGWIGMSDGLDAETHAELERQHGLVFTESELEDL